MYNKYNELYFSAINTRKRLTKKKMNTIHFASNSISRTLNYYEHNLKSKCNFYLKL